MKAKFLTIAALVLVSNMSFVYADTDCKWSSPFHYAGQHMSGECRWKHSWQGGPCLKYECNDPRVLGRKDQWGTLYCKGGMVEANLRTRPDESLKCKGLDYGECQVQFLDGGFSPKWKSGDGFPKDDSDCDIGKKAR